MDHPKDPPNELFYSRFGDDTLPLSEADIPCRPENRKKTDKAFFFVLIGSVVLVIPFVIYVLVHADLRRLDTHSKEFDFNKVAWRITLASFVSLGITIIFAALLRYATAVMVWSILIITWLFFCVMTILMWYLVAEAIVANIIITCITVVLLLVLIFMKSKIRLVTMLFKEATKASFDMRTIFFVPAATTVMLLIIAASFATTTVYMSTAMGDNSGDDDLLPNSFVAVIIVYAIVTLWVVEFMYGVQYLVMSGAVTKWYFSRNKEVLGDPVYTSFYVAMRYHLGTIALGSLIITLVAVLRAVLRSLAQNPRLRYCIDCCMRYIESFLRFFTKNAYIVTAMHGTPFVQSGKHAVKLLTLNICNTVSISSIGDFVIGMSYVLVLGLSLGATYLIFGAYEQYYACYVIVGIMSLICCFTILGTFETAFSTLFLCICQDFLINNGGDKPYAMTRNLMEYLDSSKKLFADKIQKKGLPTI